MAQHGRSYNMPISISGTTGVSLVTDASITPVKLSQPMVTMTAVNSTSGTAIDFTGIPSWAKRITVVYSNVSTNAAGAAYHIVQLGVSGTPQTTGYSSVAGAIGFANNTSGTLAATNGFIIGFATAAATVFRGLTLILTNISGNTWVGSFSGGGTDGSGGGVMTTGGGSVTLTGVPNMIRVTTANGTDLFDAGVINVQYEG